MPCSEECFHLPGLTKLLCVKEDNDQKPLGSAVNGISLSANVTRPGVSSSSEHRPWMCFCFLHSSMLGNSYLNGYTSPMDQHLKLLLCLQGCCLCASMCVCVFVWVWCVGVRFVCLSLSVCVRVCVCVCVCVPIWMPYFNSVICQRVHTQGGTHFMVLAVLTLPACQHTGGTQFMVLAVLTLPACPHTGNTLYGNSCADIAGVSTHRGEHTLWCWLC